MQQSWILRLLKSAGTRNVNVKVATVVKDSGARVPGKPEAKALSAGLFTISPIGTARWRRADSWGGGDWQRMRRLEIIK